MRRIIRSKSVLAACCALLACGEETPASPGAAAAVERPVSQGDDAPAIPPVEPSDYTTPESWLCRPDRADACADAVDATIVRADGVPATDRLGPDRDAPIDCFYVYPTVSRDRAGNADMTAGPEEGEAARLQAARFGSACRIYAPVYRQVTLTALQQMLAGEETPANREMAYADILAAWRQYLSTDNGGRGVVLIGHNQGAGLLARLIAAEIEGGPEQEKLVSVILTGATLAEPGDEGDGSLGAIPACASADSTGCAIAYVSFRADAPPPENALFGAIRNDGRRALCINPAELDGSNGQLKALLPAAATSPLMAPPPVWASGDLAVSTPLVALPGLLSARCVDQGGFHYLAVEIAADASDPRTGGIGGDMVVGGAVRPEWGLHLIDMNLALGNLVDIVKRQGAAWIAAHPPPPAPEPQLQTPP